MGRAERADDIRARLVAEAVRTLEADGPGALNARSLTRAIGTSTTAVYHHVGGMPALLRAVADHGFALLDHGLAAVAPSGDAITDIAALALAYREAARHAPHLYDLMFGLSSPGGHRPQPGTGFTTEAGPAGDAFGHLVDAVRRAMTQDRLRDGDPVHVAAQLWSMLHGYVGLELAGHLDDLADPVAEVLLPMGVNLVVGLGDDPERALASGAAALDGA